MPTVRADLAKACRYEDGGRLRRIVVALASPGMQAVLAYRFGAWTLRQPALIRPPLNVVYHLLHFTVRVLWGIEISRHACIGPGLYIGHFGGITVSGDATIGSNCNLSQSITIGVGGSGDTCDAPVIGDNVYIAPGARVFGPIRIGHNVKIGANAVVYKDIPDGAVIALDPGFCILSHKGNHRDGVEVVRSNKRRTA